MSGSFSRMTKIEINSLDSARQYLKLLPKFAHSSLILDLPTEHMMSEFYFEDFKDYADRFQHFVTSMDATWFLALNTQQEFDFFDRFQKLERLKFYNVISESLFDFPVTKIPRGIMNVSSFSTVWNTVYITLGWFSNKHFLPKKLKFTEINPLDFNGFVFVITEHMTRRLKQNKPLEYLELDENCVEERIDIDHELLRSFGSVVVDSKCVVKGICQMLLYSLEDLLDTKVFKSFLGLIKSVTGVHPVMGDVTMKNLKTITVCKAEFDLIDERWASIYTVGTLEKLTSMEVELCIPDYAPNLDRVLERKKVKNIAESLLNAVCPNLEAVSFKVKKPYWYPLEVPISKYLCNFKNLTSAKISMQLTETEVFEVLESLQNSRLTELSLERCLITDASFQCSGNCPLLFFKGTYK